jgi:hypothetical protein
MECEPTAKLEVLKLAVPPLKVPVPNVVALSINMTVPVAAVGLTTAVKVTRALNGAGFVDDETVAAEVCLTVCVSLEEVLVL